MIEFTKNAVEHDGTVNKQPRMATFLSDQFESFVRDCMWCFVVCAVLDLTYPMFPVYNSTRQQIFQYHSPPPPNVVIFGEFFLNSSWFAMVDFFGASAVRYGFLLFLRFSSSKVKIAILLSNKSVKKQGSQTKKWAVNTTNSMVFLRYCLRSYANLSQNFSAQYL